MRIRQSFLRRAAAGAALCTAVLAVASAAHAATAAAPAKAQPTAKQLAALCDTCVIVSGTVVDKRKGKATGVGAVGGAVAGSVVGNKVGDGAVATGVGAVAGGVIGNEIEKRLKRHKVWVTTVVARDGKTLQFEADADPLFKAGEVVRIDKGQLVRTAAAK